MDFNFYSPQSMTLIILINSIFIRIAYAYICRLRFILKLGTQFRLDKIVFRAVAIFFCSDEKNEIISFIAHKQYMLREIWNRCFKSSSCQIGFNIGHGQC